MTCPPLSPTALNELRFIRGGAIFVGLLNPSALAELTLAGYVTTVDGVLGLGVARITDAGINALEQVAA